MIPLLVTHNSILSRSELEPNRLQIQATLEPQLQTFSIFKEQNMAHMANQLKMCLTLSCKSWLMIGHQCRWMIDVLWLFDVLVLGFQLFFLLWCFVGPKRGCNVPKPISTIKEASIVLIVLYTPRPRKGKLFIAKKCHLCQGRGVLARFFPEGRKKKKRWVVQRHGSSQPNGRFLPSASPHTYHGDVKMSRIHEDTPEMLPTKKCFLKTGNHRKKDP